MDDMEYIDTYFKTIPAAAAKQAFDERILRDPVFAEQVAFYLSAKAVVQQDNHQQKKQQFKELYQQQKTIPLKPVIKRKIWQYAAAACVTAFIIGSSIFIFTKNPSADQMADKYIQANLTTLGVTMSSSQDSLQQALQLFNEGKLPEALYRFEGMVKRDSTNEDAKKYAGIVSLRLGNYDKALFYFNWLGNNKNLYSNPGRFYEALTLLKRNKAGDVEKAKGLLKEVSDKKLEYNHQATEWMQKL